MKKPLPFKLIIEKVYMVEGRRGARRITVLPVTRRTPKGIVYLRHGDEVNVYPSFYVHLFPTEAAAREFVRAIQHAEVASLERELEQVRKRRVHLDISLSSRTPGRRDNKILL